MNDKTQKKIGNWLNRQGNPMRFLNFADKLLPWVAIMTCILFGIGLYLSFFASPADYQQGETVRIMYIHCLLYTSPSPRDRQKSRMPSSA